MASNTFPAVAAAGGTTVRYVIKPADTVRASTATQTADPDLTTVLTAGTWLIGAQIPFNAPQNVDIAGSLTYSGTTSMIRMGFHTLSIGATDPTVGTDYATYRTYSTLNNVFGGTDGGNDSWIGIEAIMVATSGGNLAFQWSQRVSNASSTTLRAGAYITAIKIA